MPRQRVVITGIGAVTPAGLSATESFRNLAAGRSFTRLVSPAELDWPARYRIDAGELFPAAPVAAEPLGTMDHQLTRLSRMALSEALAQSGWTAADRGAAGLSLGASKGDLSCPEEIARVMPGDPAVCLGSEFGFGAGWIAPVAACATGLIAVGQAWERINWGDWTRAAAGGVDSSLHPGLVSSYRRLGVLSRERTDGGIACRPFDESRSGFAVGEGAGTVILESADVASRRGAIPLAEITGYALRSDAAGPLQLPTRPDALSAAIRQSLRIAAIPETEIDAISLHGTGTMANDRLEAAALRQVFGDRIDSIPAWSCKGAIGHLLGASGAVELAMLVEALRNGVVPPTVNLRNPSPDCGLGHVIGMARPGTFRTGLKIALGFGGHCAAMVVSVPPGFHENLAAAKKAGGRRRVS